MEKKDILTRAVVGDTRIYVARTTRLVRKIALRHKMSHLASAAVGRTVTAALLLSATMKNDEGVAIRICGDGPIGKVVGEAQGCVARGYADNPDIYLAPRNGHLDVGGAVGKGTLTVTRFMADGKQFSGTADLVDGEIADDITNYLYTSEQTPSSVALGVLVSKLGDVDAAGGWFIQALPHCDEKVLEKLDANVKKTPYISHLIDMGYEPERIIRMLGDGLDVEILDTLELDFGCRCGKDRVSAVLKTLPEKDLRELAADGEIEVKCPYCGNAYAFGADEIMSLIKK